MKSKSGIRGRVVAELRGPDGKLKLRQVHHNLVTDVGDETFASLGTAGWTYRMKLGGASTAASKNGAGSFVAVADYIAGSASAMEATFPKEGGSANIAQYKCIWAAGEATGTIRRVGLVDNADDAGEADASNTAAMGVFDADIPKAKGCAEGDKYITKTYRKGWTLNG